MQPHNRILVSLLAVAFSVASAPCVQAAEEEEETVEVEAYEVNRPSVRQQRPEMKVEKPRLEADFSFETVKPSAPKPEMALKLDPASFSGAIQVEPEDNTAPARPPAPRDSAPPREETPIEAGHPQPGPGSGPAEPAPARPDQEPASEPESSAGPEARIVPLDLPSPRYPRQAYLDGVEGYVVVEFMIGTSGEVEELDIIEAEPRGVFERETSRAVRRWTFEPVIVDGRPAPYRVKRRIDFTMN